MSIRHDAAQNQILNENTT